MSAVVNGHREDENTTHARPHGHILPMLSFSASTPTDEDNPLDSNAAIAIDMTLWEQPEDAIAPSIQISSQDDLNDDDLGGRNAEAVPLIDVARDVILVDGPDGEDDEVDENAPLLAGGSRGVGSSIMGMGLRVCSDDGNIGGLGIPVNMPRSEGGDGGERQRVLKNISQTSSSVSELRDVASHLVFEVISQAQAKASNTNNLNSKEEAAMVADGGVRGKRGPQSLASPASNHAERLFRGGPWYVQMGRVFSAFVSRICPCRCPTKP